jgi:signal transduction histidine kinase/tetratricopeptide (TPR) repeat protein
MWRLIQNQRYISKLSGINRLVVFISALFILVLAIMIINFDWHNYSKEVSKEMSLARKYQSHSLKKAYHHADIALAEALNHRNDTLSGSIYEFLGANLILQGRNNEAYIYFRKSLELYTARKYYKGISSALLEMGMIHYNWGNYLKSFEFFNNALLMSQEQRLISTEALANNYIGKYYHTIGNFKRSVEFYRKSIELYQQTGNVEQSVSVLLSIGKTYMNEGNFHKALWCYLTAHKQSEKLNDLMALADVCNHLGSIYLILHQPENSLKYHYKALQIRKSLDNLDGMAKSHNNLGETYLSMHQLDSAHYHFKKSLEFCNLTGYMKGTIKALTNLGSVYNESEKPTKAISFLQKSITLASQCDYQAGIAESSLALGQSYLLNEDYLAGAKYFTTSLQKAKLASLQDIECKSYYQLYQCYTKLNKISLALENYIQYADLEKKNLLAENNYQLAGLQAAFEIEKKEKDNQVLRKDLELRNMAYKRKSAMMWLVIIAFSFTVMLCIIIYSRFKNNKKANQELQNLNECIINQYKELDILNKELKLANQEKDKILSIISHELRNPLFWFQNLAEVLSIRFQSMEKEKVQKSLNALDESAKNAFHLMDNLLHWSRSRLNRITPKKSPRTLSTLIEESTRMYESILRHKEISLSAHISAEIQILADPDLFSCVIRNIVSNAIKFTPSGGNISINCEEINNEVNICISDSGIGISEQNIEHLFDNNKNLSSEGLMHEKGSGFGLKLCKEFTELNGGRIHISSKVGMGTTISIILPKLILEKDTVQKFEYEYC